MKFPPGRPASFALGLVCFVALWLEIFSFPTAVVSPSLDNSWAAALVYFAQHKLQFGKDVIFTYGPLGHLVTETYIGEKIPVWRVLWEFAATTAVAALILLAIAHMPRLWRIAAAAYVLLFFRADLSIDSSYVFAIFAVAALLLHHRPPLPWASLAAALFAIASLVKVSYLSAAIAAMLPLVFGYALSASLSGAGVLLLSFFAAFVLAWLCAGQSLANLPQFLALWAQVAIGNKDAMPIPAANTAVLCAGVVMLLIAGAICLRLLSSRRSPAELAPVALFAAAVYLAWNRGFTRADDHVSHFFAIVPPLALLTASHLEKGRGRFCHVATAILFVIALAGLYAQRATNLTRALPTFVERAGRAVLVLRHIGTIESDLHAMFLDRAQRHALPRVKQVVGAGTLDVFGHEQGIAILNRLNYTPRPVFQSYLAYTRRLLAANARFYGSSAAPQFVLMKLQTIDGRYPAADDAPALREIISRYEPLFGEQGYWLWQRTEGMQHTAAREAADISLPFGRPFNLPPGERLFLQLEIKKSVAGRLFDLIYKAPLLSLHTTDGTGSSRSFRLIPAMSAAGFQIAPQLLDTPQVATLRAQTNAAAVRSFSVDVAPAWRWFYRRGMRCRISASP